MIAVFTYMENGWIAKQGVYSWNCYSKKWLC